MTTVNVYLPDYSDKQARVLAALAEGIPGAKLRALGDYMPSDVAVIFGYAKDSYPPTWPKREILERHTGTRLLMVESAFVKRGEYYQVGWGGSAGNADFRTDGVPMDRWESFGIKTKPWKRRPDAPIVVCGQVPWDTQVQDVDHKAWCKTMIRDLQNAGYEVWFRPHPRIRTGKAYGVRGVYLDKDKMKRTVVNVQAAVTWNSTSAVDFAMAGVPVFAFDRGSMAWPIAGHNMARLLNGKFSYPSRRDWLAGIGYSQWTLDEMRRGLPWNHLTR
jgi:hypothetical protein